MEQSKRILYPFTIASVVMFISLFFGPKIGAVGLIIWLIALIWTMNKTLFVRYSVSDLTKKNEELMEESFKEKRYVESSARLLVLPMMVLGVGVIIVNLIIMLIFL